MDVNITLVTSNTTLTKRNGTTLNIYNEFVNGCSLTSKNIHVLVAEKQT